jgi:hypothetical protein
MKEIYLPLLVTFLKVHIDLEQEMLRMFILHQQTLVADNVAISPPALMRIVIVFKRVKKA